MHGENLSNDQRLIIVLSTYESAVDKKTLTKRCRDVGLESIARNINEYLRRIKASLIKTASGYELNASGRKQATALGAGEKKTKAIDPLLSQLGTIASSITDNDIQSFVDEAIACLDEELYRAGIVLSWVGAVATLQAYVVANHLAAFNADAKNRFPNDWKKPAKKTTDLGRLKEADLLLVLESIGVISKNVKQELEGCLKLRNACGHPGGLKVGQHKAAAHVETLLQNVYTVFV